MNPRFFSFAVTVACSTAVAHAQSFNLDMGSEYGTPSSDYGAAAGQSGVWHELVGNDPGPFPLNGLDGAPTGVTLSMNLPFGPGSADNFGTFGDDEALLDDYWPLGSRPANFTFEGLEAGVYQVWVYAWAADSSDFNTLVTMGEDSQQVGGFWPGQLEQGVTHAFFEPRVAAGGTIDLFCRGIGSGTLNGIQIFKAGPCPSDRNADGFVDAIDYDEFISLWIVSDPAADYEGDGFVDAIDYDLFIGDWLNGC